ncbi:MAG: hypothetical protein RLZZ126_141 [Pseudomonadota bacterium]|jgi:tRNA nucleotidyltransferase (CCA-adding enzyme)
MDIYLVGGAVRDALLGLPVTDRDWVVVGSSPEEMLARGYTPVGRDFPVFLHPQTHEEYALARTERKTAPGYRGFVFHAGPEVTLEQDLARRDITINSIAVFAHQISENTSKSLKFSAEALVDPFGGLQDLQQRRIRHTNDAFREDPVRILRVARFAARFADFEISADTLALMRDMVACGEVRALVAERVWTEVAKGLMTGRPARMLAALQDTGALQHLLEQPASPSPSPGHGTGASLDAAARANAPLPVRYACWTAEAGHLAKAPRDCAELASLVRAHWSSLVRSGSMSAASCMDLMQSCDAFRRPERFGELLVAAECLGAEPLRHVLEAHAAARKVVLPHPAPAGPAAGQVLRALRLDAIAKAGF